MLVKQCFATFWWRLMMCSRNFTPAAFSETGFASFCRSGKASVIVASVRGTAGAARSKYSNAFAIWCTCCSPGRRHGFRKGTSLFKLSRRSFVALRMTFGETEGDLVEFFAKCSAECRDEFGKRRVVHRRSTPFLRSRASGPPVGREWSHGVCVSDCGVNT